MRQADILFLLLAGSTACGARTPLEVIGSSTLADGGVVGGPDATAACTTPTPVPAGPCSGWRADGAEQVVSATPTIDSAIGLGDAVAAGCGVLTAWYTLTPPNAQTLSWSTRSVGFDGAPRAPIEAHPSLTLQTTGSGAFSLATNGANVAGLEVDSSGCRFLALDTDGAEVGPITPQKDVGCGAIAAEGDGFSYLSPSGGGGTPVTLNRVDAHGVLRSSRMLPIGPGRALWGRYVYDDGTFLLNTFAEDPMTTVYTDWLQRFGAGGDIVGGEVIVGANTAPVWLAATSTGVLAGWEWSAVNLVPLDRNGTRTGPPQAHMTTGALYGMTIVPVPNGDALLLWLVLDADNGFSLFAQAVAPDGTARAPATLIRKSKDQSRVYAVVAPEGDRALLVLQDGGVRTVPIACVR
jgi:hypothetical protein